MEFAGIQLVTSWPFAGSVAIERLKKPFVSSEASKSNIQPVYNFNTEI